MWDERQHGIEVFLFDVERDVAGPSLALGSLGKLRDFFDTEDLVIGKLKKCFAFQFTQRPKSERLRVEADRAGKVRRLKNHMAHPGAARPRLAPHTDFHVIVVRIVEAEEFHERRISRVVLRITAFNA